MASDCLMFVGSLNREAPYFQGARGVGLSVYALDGVTGDTELLAETTAIDNPTFLSVTPDGTRVYANSEIFGWREGLVSAFRFDRDARTLDYINMQPTLGSITAHNCLTRDGRYLMAANYGIGSGGPEQSLVVFGLRDDGGLTPAVASVAHAGAHGPNAGRQERGHAHSITETVRGGIAIAADLGFDELISYRIAPSGALERVSSLALSPGAGPRHVAMHPNGRFLFVMNELDSTVASLSLDPATGALALIDVKPAVAAEARDHNHCADIQISPDGRFVYGSNRGHDSIPIFAVDAGSGALTLVDYTPCGGSTPRNIALSPSGGLLFSANQNADRISIFSRDPDTGRLADTGKAVVIGTPMCVRIVTAG